MYTTVGARCTYPPVKLILLYENAARERRKKKRELPLMKSSEKADCVFPWVRADAGVTKG